MTEQEVVKLMRTSKSEIEWNSNCDKVKAKFKSTYPPFWYKAIILSGVVSTMQRSWARRN